eukprot:s2085_g2.t1
MATNRKCMPTCRRCTVYWLNSILLFQKQKHQKCHGPLKRQQLFNSSGRRPAWKQATLARRQQLSKVWNITKQELKDLNSSGKSKRSVPRSVFWKKDLTADGDIEPNPGPLRLASLNCQGKNNAFNALPVLTSQFDLVLLQETNFSLRDAQNFSRQALQLGFRTWHAGNKDKKAAATA